MLPWLELRRDGVVRLVIGHDSFVDDAMIQSSTVDHVYEMMYSIGSQAYLCKRYDTKNS